ncbi:MAG TPA: ABC transporter substrate-binding protein [Candidatus Dormibacteraeota bacterium]|jgi:ABC-type nitrate/sulfonate/bicarbonate transport system substrate-binding protein
MVRRFAVALAGLVLATGCGGSSGGSSSTPPPGQKATCTSRNVTIAVPVTPPNVVHLPPYMAQDMGIFKDEGLNVTIARFEGGVAAFRAMAGGSVDLAGTSSEPFITAVSQGADVKAVYSYAPNVDVSFVVGPNIKSPADLKGKKIGIQEAGGFADVMSRLVLKKYGISPNDVQFVTTTTAGRVTELVAGNVDTGVLHIDQTLTIQAKNPGIHVLANMWDVVKDYQYSLWAVSGSLISSDPAAVECMVRALIRADRAMYDTSKRQQILDIAVKYTKEDPAVVAQTYDQLVKAKAWPQNLGIPQANVAGTEKSLKDSNQISTVPSFSALVDLSTANRVVSQLGKVSNFPY